MGKNDLAAKTSVKPKQSKSILPGALDCTPHCWSSVNNSERPKQPNDTTLEVVPAPLLVSIDQDNVITDDREESVKSMPCVPDCLSTVKEMTRQKRAIIVGPGPDSEHYELYKEESESYLLKNGCKVDLNEATTGNTSRGKQNETPLLIHRKKKQLQITDFVRASIGKSRSLAVSTAVKGNIAEAKSNCCDDDDSKRNKYTKDAVVDDGGKKNCIKQNVPCCRYKASIKEKAIMSSNESDSKQLKEDSRDGEATGENSNTEEKVVKNKKLLKKKERDALVVDRSSRDPDPVSEPVAGPSRIVLSPTRPVGINLTSTPVKIKNLKNKEKKRENRPKRGKFVRRRSVQVAKKLLDVRGKQRRIQL